MNKLFKIGMTVVAVLMLASCGSKKDQAETTEAGGETTEQAEGASEASEATAGENGYLTYDNKKGYTIDIPNGMFKYKNKILDEKDGEEGLLQYTMEKDNTLNNQISVYFKDRDDLTADVVRKSTRIGKRPTKTPPSRKTS